MFLMCFLILNEKDFHDKIYPSLGDGFIAIDDLSRSSASKVQIEFKTYIDTACALLMFSKAIYS
ncbi:hypothetical protein Z042_06700 [Chania multitudinisentens RB-25]|uniref:Uncharacterized protein n=1 Tax=Chania multitudinisentens RB-25 TaxID=1441930 RepID=W0LJS1_9GAMM|nr:hypothetical protein Z042_06700 [Chania multitudinisentens RB-25]